MYTDDDIIRLCQQGRQEGFALLLDRYQARVYRRAYTFLRHREDVLDATQEVFLRVLQAVRHFQRGRAIWPWLRQVTTNTCLNRLRAAERRPPTVSLDGEWERLQDVAAEGDPEQQALMAWDRARLERGLEALPPEHRMAIVLRHQEGLTYNEIAQAMQLPLGTVKTYLFRGRRALRAALEAPAPMPREKLAVPPAGVEGEAG